jgi:hypothetical protein
MKLILKKHRNALLELIRAAKLDPQAFRPTEEATEKGEVFRLEFSGSPHYFVLSARLENERRLFFYKCSTFTISYPNPQIGEESAQYWQSWKGTFVNPIEIAFKAWLSMINKYLKYLAEEEEDSMIPDLWSGINWASSNTTNIQTLQNTPFSSAEQARITESLSELEREVREQGFLSEEQLNLLHEQVKYLVDASKRLGRKDWIIAAAGALMSYTLQVGLTSEHAIQLLRMVGTALKWIAHSPLYLPS